MFKKLKIELSAMAITGTFCILLRVLEFEKSGHEQLWIILQLIAAISFGISTICLMFNSAKK